MTKSRYVRSSTYKEVRAREHTNATRARAHSIIGSDCRQMCLLVLSFPSQFWLWHTWLSPFRPPTELVRFYHVHSNTVTRLKCTKCNDRFSHTVRYTNNTSKKWFHIDFRTLSDTRIIQKQEMNPYTENTFELLY